MTGNAKLLVNDTLNTLNTRCSEPTSHQNCTKTFMVSTTCVESDEVCDDHLSQTLIPCPAGREGNCTRFNVQWCDNTIYPQKGGCYRSEYAHTGMMDYAEYWFGFSLLLPAKSLPDVDAIHFQVGPKQCKIQNTLFNHHFSCCVNSDMYSDTHNSVDDVIGYDYRSTVTLTMTCA